MAAGSVIIDFLFRTGSFQTDTDRAAKSLNKLKKEAADTGRTIGDSLAKLGAITLGAGTVGGLVALVKSTIDAADHLNDLSKKTGVAVETLGGVGFAASQAGGDLETVTAAFVKLDRSIADALGGNQQAIADFKDLGISLKDLQTLTPDQIFAKLADGFQGTEEGALKTAQATRVLGKAGADQLALLDDGGEALLKNIEYYKKYSGVTEETAKKADEFNDTLGKIKLLSGAFAQTLTSELLPTLQSLADLWLTNKEQAGGFRQSASDIVTLFKALAVAAYFAAKTFVVTGDQIGALVAKANALAHLDFDAFDRIGKEASANLNQARKDFDSFYSALYDGNKKIDQLDDSPKPPKKRGGGKIDDAAAKEAASALKKQLDGQIKLIEDFAKAQANALQGGNQYLEQAYSEGLLSQKDFFNQQKNIRDQALQDQLTAIDKEIAAQQAFIRNPLSKPADRVAAEEKIKLAVQQRAEAVTQASQTEILAQQANQHAAELLGQAYEGLKAQVLSLAGNDLGAAQIRIAQQFKQAQDLITQAGGDPAVANRLKDLLTLQAQAAQQQKDYAKLLHDTQLIEQNIYLDAQKNGAGELGTLAAIRDARTVAIQQLREQAAAAAQLAAASGTDQDKQRAADLATAVKTAESQIDPLAKKINSDLSDAFQQPFKDFVKGTESAKDAFKNFVDNIASMALDLAAKDIASSIFGTGSGQGSAGGFLSGLFSSGASSGGSSGGSFLGSLANFFGGFFAAGGNPPVGKPSVVGENGPELFVPRTAGTVIPNDAFNGGTRNQRTTVNNISVAPPAGTDRATAMQIGATIARQLAVADRRNN